jgi:hypothetical protein
MKQINKRIWILPLIIVSALLLVGNVEAYTRSNFKDYFSMDTANISGTLVTNWGSGGTGKEFGSPVNGKVGVINEAINFSTGTSDRIGVSTTISGSSFSYGGWINVTTSTAQPGNPGVIGDTGGNCALAIGIYGGIGTNGKYNWVCGNVVGATSTTSVSAPNTKANFVVGVCDPGNTKAILIIIISREP